MATVIQIKRTTGVSSPTVSDLSEAELAYVQDRSNDGASSKLFIESVDSSSNPVIHEIGGKYLIAVVKHAINNGKGITKLGLVRDSVGRDGKPHSGSMVN